MFQKHSQRLLDPPVIGEGYAHDLAQCSVRSTRVDLVLSADSLEQGEPVVEVGAEEERQGMEADWHQNKEKLFTYILVRTVIHRLICSTYRPMACFDFEISR